MKAMTIEDDAQWDKRFAHLIDPTYYERSQREPSSGPLASSLAWLIPLMRMVEREDESPNEPVSSVESGDRNLREMLAWVGKQSHGKH